MSPFAEPSAQTSRLANGLGVISLALPQLQTAHVAVFVRAGSAHERPAQSGISHLLEHMAFKGTRTRDVQRINRDAEILGAEVNAHTDKDHTAFYMTGLGGHAPRFVRMLGDIVCHAALPPQELERERAVLLQEVAEWEDDAVNAAYQGFDAACWGRQSCARPVIGHARQIESLGRDAMLAYRQAHYRAGNMVLVAAGAVQHETLLRAAEVAFRALPPGAPPPLAPARPGGGLRLRRMGGGRQTHAVLGYALPQLAHDDPLPELAAALLGEGMSSPLLAQLRERQGLVYHAACSAQRFEFGGQWAIEASFAPAQLQAVLTTTTQILRSQAQGLEATELRRARNQVLVRFLGQQDRLERCAEDAAQDWFAAGRLRSPAQRLARLRGVSGPRLQRWFAQLLETEPSLALGGSLPRGAREVAQQALLDLRAPLR